MKSAVISSRCLVVVKDDVLVSNNLVDELLVNHLDCRIESPGIPAIGSVRENLRERVDQFVFLGIRVTRPRLRILCDRGSDDVEQMLPHLSFRHLKGVASRRKQVQHGSDRAVNRELEVGPAPPIDRFQQKATRKPNALLPFAVFLH